MTLTQDDDDPAPATPVPLVTLQRRTGRRLSSGLSSAPARMGKKSHFQVAAADEDTTNEGISAAAGAADARSLFLETAG